MATTAGTRLSTGHVGLNVSDLRRSTRFYREVFGGEVAFSMELDGGFLAAMLLSPRGVDGRLNWMTFFAHSRHRSLEQRISELRSPSHSIRWSAFEPSTGTMELPRRLLKVSGGSVDDYATFSASIFTMPSC